MRGLENSSSASCPVCSDADVAPESAVAVARPHHSLVSLRSRIAMPVRMRRRSLDRNRKCHDQAGSRLEQQNVQVHSCPDFWNRDYLTQLFCCEAFQQYICNSVRTNKSATVYVITV